MNPKYHLLVAVAALSLGACSTDDTCTEPGPGKKGYKLSFTVAEDPETRTTLDAGDVLRWVYTDKVGIYTVGKNTNSNTLTVADVNQSPVEFIGVLENYVSSGDKFYAYYPYDAEQSADPAAVTLSIPAQQTQTTAGVYNGETHPLVALPTEINWEHNSYAGRISSVRFRQLGAIVELQLYSSDEALRSESIRSVTFESDTPLAGDFSFDLTGVTVKEKLPISGYESKKVTTSLEEPAAIPATGDEAARVYLTIAPGQYTGQIIVKTDAAQYTFRLAEAMTFERAVIKGLPADLAKADRKASSSDDPVTENDAIRFEDPLVEEICLEHWDANGDCQLSYKEAAAVTSIESQFQIAKKTFIRSFNELQYFTGLQSINAKAFSGCSSLTSITIPNGVTTIGDSAIQDCSSLTSINIPDEVTAIGNFAFYGCSSLTNIHLPDGVTAIGNYAFSYCSGLTSINIPDGVTTIKEYTFSGCGSLRSILIPNGVTTIGNNAFYECRSLISITIPDGVTEIKTSTFEGCSSLTSIVIPKEVTAIGHSAFRDCSSLTSIDIPGGMTKISSNTFSGCSSLTNVNIPEGVTAIGDEVFSGCSSLTSINIPKTVLSIGRLAFKNCSSLSAFYGKYASADHRYLIQYGTLFAFAPADLTDYTIPDEVTTIGSYAFHECRSLTSIHIPNGVTEIGNDAFLGCSSLRSIHLPDGLTMIGDSAFHDCRSLTSINIPDGVISIGYMAFLNCDSLISVYCKPTTPPTIGAHAFERTPSSMKIYVPTASVEAYKTGGWSVYASQIFADNN